MQKAFELESFEDMFKGFKIFQWGFNPFCYVCSVSIGLNRFGREKNRTEINRFEPVFILVQNRTEPKMLSPNDSFV
jgi:hypothetical protein